MSDTGAARFFDKTVSQAYDERQRRLNTIVDNLHFLIGLVLRDLPEDARVLCVGVGTGGEIVRLGKANPGWRFTGVEPSADMLEVCQKTLDREGLGERSALFNGYLHELEGGETFDAVLCLLVTHFVTDESERQALFDAMADRLKQRGILINADISGEMSAPDFVDILGAWLALQMESHTDPEQAKKIVEALGTHVAVAPPERIEAYLKSAGLPTPVQFFQSLLVRAWYARKPSG